MPRSYHIEQKSADAAAAITITVYTKLDMDSAKEVYMAVTQLLNSGQRKFTFDLHDLDFCDSQTLASWIMINKAVVDQLGSVEFKVKCNSQVHNLLLASKLDKLLSITIGDTIAHDLLNSEV